MKHNYTIGFPQDKPHYRKAFLLAYLLDCSFKKTMNQYQRIQYGKSIQDIEHQIILFGDIHFFLISATHLGKILKELVGIFKEDSILAEIFSKYSPTLKLLKDLRDHNEHILEGRLDGKGSYGKVALSEPNMLGNLFDDEYNFGGQKINLVTADKQINELLKELKAWNIKTHIYPLWK